MLPLLISVQEISARIALVTDQGIASVIRRNYSKPVLYGIVGLLLVANTINLGADLGAMADSARPLVNLPYYLYVFAFGLIALLLEVMVPYKHYAPILKLLTVSLLAYFLTGLIATRDWATVFRATFVPHVRFDFQFLMIIVGGSVPQFPRTASFGKRHRNLKRSAPTEMRPASPEASWKTPAQIRPSA